MSGIENFPDWKSLQGITLEGGYELKEIVEAERDRAMVRVRVLGDYTLKATASFYVLERVLAEKQLESWESIRRFGRKADLSVPLGAGILSLDGSTVPYVVLQVPDESLAEVVKARPLAPEEANEVLRSNVRALDKLHANGFVHGCVSPDEILAVGESIQLSTEAVREVNSEPIVERKEAKYLAPESGSRNLTIASDVWCLGATLFETLTQKAFEPGLLNEAINLKHPFGAVASRCLEPDPDQRCKLAEIEGILRSKAPTPKPKLALVIPVEAAKAAAAGSPVTDVVPPIQVVGAPVRPETAERTQKPSGALETRVPAARASAGSAAAELVTPRLPQASAKASQPSERVTPLLRNERPEPRTRRAEETKSFGGKRGLIYAIAGLVIILLSLWLVRSRSGASPGASPASHDAGLAARSGGSERPGTAWPTQTLSPDAKAPAAVHTDNRPSAASQKPAPVSVGQGKTVWRVVLYTYVHQTDAEARAKEVGAKHPELHLQVFSPESGGPYLVTAGGGMDRQAASRLRLKAVREGMPHDTYIQNYTK